MGLSAVPAAAGTEGVRMRDTSAQDRIVAAGPERPRRVWWISAIALVLLAITALAGWRHWHGAERSVAAERLRLASVERGDFVRDIGVQGTIVAAVSPTLFAPSSGTVTLAVQAGDSVEAGQAIATIDSPALTSRLNQESASLDGLIVDIDRSRIEARQRALEARQTADLAKVRITAAERELRRAEASREYEVISEQDYEKARDDLETARLSYAHALQDLELVTDTANFEIRTRELQRDRQQLLVQEIERQVAELTIVSPVTGMVGDLAVDQRAAVVANQPLVTVVDLGAFEVELGLPESYGDDVGLGMDVEVSYGGNSYAGFIAAVSPEVKNNEVAARVRFADAAPAGLRQNQRVSARVLFESKSDVLTLKRGPFLDSGGGRIVYVVEDGIATRRPVLTGSISIGAVEIVEGLDAGEVVIISSTELFEGADTVRLID